MKHKLKRLFDILRYDIPRFVKNVWTFRKALINTRSWDYAGSLHYLKTHLEQLEPAVRNGHHVNGERVAKKIKTCRCLLERILEWSDQYMLYDIDAEFEGSRMKFKYTPKNTEHPRINTKTYASIIKNKENDEWELLFKLLTKHLASFWD